MDSQLHRASELLPAGSAVPGRGCIRSMGLCPGVPAGRGVGDHNVSV